MGIVQPLSSGLGIRQWTWFILTILAVTAPRVFANDCQLKNHYGDDVTTSQWNSYIDLQTTLGWAVLKDTAPAGVDYYTFRGAENVVSVKTESKYFEAVYSETEAAVHIRTTENFPDMKKDAGSSVIADLSLLFTCKGGSRDLQIYFKIEDSNKYPPEMEKITYKYTPAMPLPKGYVLTSGEPIKGIDYDYTTTNIRANIASDLFDASIVKSGSWREGFEVIIKTTKEVRLQEKVVMPLTIEDEGTSADKTTCKVEISITIDPDLENSVFNPRFM